jgi:4-amino-4-deoxy-L-arabinose transferase-like glycosyltransferase
MPSNGPPAPVLTPAGAPAQAAARGGGDTRRFWAWAVPGLLLLAVLTRLPSFTDVLWNPDEGFLATEARQLAHGGVLYDTVVDRKPPLLPWLYRGAFAVFGDDSLRPLKAAAVLATAATALLLASLARRRWGDRAGWTAGTLSVLLSVGLSPEDTQAATFEVFMLPWTAAAMWCADRRRWACAGLAVALAALTKQTGGAVLLPVLFLLWRRPGPWGRSLGGLLAAFAAPVVAVALALGPGRFLFWTVSGSGSYVSVAGAELVAAERALGQTAVLAAAAAPVLAALAWAARRRRPLEAADVWVWLAASGLAVCVGFQFFGHYFLQLTPPLALLGAAALRHARLRGAVATVAASAVIAAAFVTWGLLVPRPELAHAQRVAAAVRARTAPTDRVLMWGMHPEDYWLADRRPAARYLTAGFLTNFSGGRHGIRTGERYAVPGSWPRFLHDLRTHPPTVVVDDSRGAPYAVAHTPTLRAYLTAHYTRTARVDGAVLYVRTGTS